MLDGWMLRLRRKEVSFLSFLEILISDVTKLGISVVLKKSSRRSLLLGIYIFKTDGQNISKVINKDVIFGDKKGI